MTKSLLVILAIAAAGPASAADSIRISLAGKTPAQVESEIRRAAQTVCARGVVSPLEIYSYCVRDTVRHAKAQIAPQAAGAKSAKLASAR